MVYVGCAQGVLLPFRGIYETEVYAIRPAGFVLLFVLYGAAM